MTKIEWTRNADGTQGETWNPIVGCSLASPGCTNCYAMPIARRLEAMGVPAYEGLTRDSKAGPVWTGKLAFSDSALLKPLSWKKPRTVFVNSMGDLFHEDCPDEWIDRVFAVMALCPQHTFQVLTKRAGRMREYLSAWSGDWSRTDAVWEQIYRLTEAGAGEPGDREIALPLPNVWLGVSVEDQRRADERIPDLLATPAAVRWISAEPLLGPVDLNRIREEFDDGLGVKWESALDGKRFSPWVGDDEDPMIPGFPKLDWVVVGGESGKGARPIHPDWARSLRDQCAAAGVPFFFKQWGEWRETDGPKTTRHNRLVGQGTNWLTRNGQLHPRNAGFSIYHEYKVAKIGKKRAGRLLDGIEHNGMPGVAQ